MLAVSLWPDLCGVFSEKCRTKFPSGERVDDCWQFCDAGLKSLVESNGTEGKWGIIANVLGTRTARQYRER
jgi:hypothetical protein